MGDILWVGKISYIFLGCLKIPDFFFFFLGGGGGG